jgi:hypothetical protein
MTGNDPENLNDEVFWFCLDKDGSPVFSGLDEKGEITSSFKACKYKEFEYSTEEHGLLLCPDCCEKKLEDIYKGKSPDE